MLLPPIDQTKESNELFMNETKEEKIVRHEQKELERLVVNSSNKNHIAHENEVGSFN